jgi:hypothetical protein
VRKPASWPRSLIATCLLLAAGLSIPLAFRERATADFLTVAANEAWTQEARAVTLEQASGYYAAFWFDLGVAVFLVLLGTALLLRAGRSWFAISALVAGFAAASGVWALIGDRAEVPGGLPVAVLATALTVVAAIAAIASVEGWAATGPPLAPRGALNPPVPPSHQAG